MFDVKIKPIEAVTVTVEATISSNDLTDFVDFLVSYSDVFGQGYIGYWACGVRLRDPTQEGVDGQKLPDGWLVCEMHDEMQPTEDDVVKIVAHFRETGERKFDFKGEDGELTIHRLDVEAGVAIAKQLVQDNAKYRGLGPDGAFPLDYDGSSLDNAIQRALLGDVVYG